MATAIILGQTQDILSSSDSAGGEGALSITPYFDEDEWSQMAILESSLFEFDREDAKNSLFSNLKTIFKSEQDVVVTIISPEDENGDPLIDVAKTEVLSKSDGTFTVYNPDFEKLAHGQTAEFVFTYAVNNGDGANLVVRDVALLITGTNEAPVAVDHEDKAVDEDSILTGQLVAIDIDSDDDATSLTYELIWTDIPAGFTLNPDGSYELDAGVPEYQYLSEGEVINYSFSWQARDRHGVLSGVDEVVITITGTNDAPVAIVQDDQATVEDSILTGQLAATDIDSDDDATSLTYELVETDIPAGFTLNPAGSYELDAGMDAYQDLSEGEVRNYRFSWQARDSHDATSSVEQVAVAVTGTNDTPTVAASLQSDTDEDAASYTIDLLEGAADIDNNAILHVENVQEVNNKGGWSLDGSILTVNPDHYDDMNTGDFEALNIAYQVVDEHGAGTNQTLTVNIAGITDAPSLEITTSAGEQANEIRLHIVSEPAKDESVRLTFDVPGVGAAVFDSSPNDVNANDVTAGVEDFAGNTYFGSATFTLVLPPNIDTKGEVTVSAIGVDDNGEIIGSTLLPVEIAYDYAANATETLTFASEDQNMWGDFDGQIGWHEYIPLIGDDPIVWNDTTRSWDEVGDPEGAYWKSGSVDIIDVGVSDEDIGHWAETTLSKYEHVKAVVAGWADYLLKEVGYFAAKLAYETTDFASGGTQAALDFALQAEEAAQSTYNSSVTTEESAWQVYDASKIYIFGIPVYDPIKTAVWLATKAKAGADWLLLQAAHGAVAVAEAAHDAADDGAQFFLDAMNNAETAKNQAYADATASEEAMHDDGFYEDRAWAEGDPVNIVEEGLAFVDAGLATAINAGIDDLDFTADLELEAELFARAGLQVDFELDLGSVDTSVDYQLTAQTQYNQSTDMLAITPMMTNLTDGDSVAFSTVSPNATFYAALLYDVGVDVDLFTDAYLYDGGNEIFDISPGTEGIHLSPTISTNSWTDLMATIPSEYQPELTDDIGAGELVLIDFDSTEGEPFEVPFIESLTEDILSIELDFPTVKTDGTAVTLGDPTTESVMDYYDEGGFVNFDISELTDTFLNIVNAKIDFSPELKELHNLPSLEDSDSLAEAFGLVAKALFETLLDTLDGQSEAVPIFLMDATDETDSSLLHVNLFDFNSDHLLDPEYSYTSGIDEDTGSLGFYAAYGESDPVIKVNIDIDAAVAVIVNKVLEAIAAAGTAGATAGATAAIPDFNPLNLEFGIDQILEMVEVPKETRDKITDYIDLGMTYEAADIDASASMDFSQEFTLSIDDMAYALTLEDGTTKVFTANETEAMILNNASEYDSDGDGVIGYDLSIVPQAMFSNDTEIGLSLGYVLDFFKGEFKAGVKLPISDWLGLPGDNWPDIELPMIDIGLGPLLRLQGDLDFLDVDVFESRFSIDVGTNTFESNIDIDIVGIDTTTNDDVAWA